MKRLSNVSAVIAAILLAAVPQAKADSIYNNGTPSNGSLGGYLLNGLHDLSISFPSSGSFNLTSAQINLFTNFGVTPSTVAWSIGTTPFASDISSGVSSLANTFLFTNAGGYFYQSTFSISGAIGVGTFYLTLGHLTTNFPPGLVDVFWDLSDGSSASYVDFAPTTPLDHSNAFAVFGTPVPAGPSVPEGGQTATYLALGLAGMGWLRRAWSCG